MLKKLHGEVFNGTRCGYTRGAGRAGKKRLGSGSGSLTEGSVKFRPGVGWNRQYNVGLTAGL